VFKGALTSKIGSFRSRVWELYSKNTIDIFDGSLTPLKIDYKGQEIFKVTSILTPYFKNKMFNFSWISDRTRYMQDSLQKMRVSEPFISIDNNVFIFVSFQYLEKIISFYISKNLIFLIEEKKFDFIVIFGKLVDLKTIFFFKYVSNFLGFSNLCLEESNILLSNKRSDYSLSSTNFEDFHCIVLVGINTRKDNTLINFKLKGISSKMPIFSIGSSCEFDFKCRSLGNNIKNVFNILEGRDRSFSKIDLDVTLFIFGLDYLYKGINLNLFSYKFNFCFLSNRVSGLNTSELGLPFMKKGFFKKKKKIIYALDTVIKIKKNKDFLVAQGSHYSESASNVVIPDKSFLESRKYYFNFLGDILNSEKVLDSLESDWNSDRFRSCFLSDLFFYSKKFRVQVLNSLFSYNYCDKGLKKKILKEMVNEYKKIFVVFQKQKSGIYVFLSFNNFFKKYIKVYKGNDRVFSLKRGSCAINYPYSNKNSVIILNYENFYLNNNIVKNSFTLNKASEFSFFFNRSYTKNI
jgi:hypothetical protein